MKDLIKNVILLLVMIAVLVLMIINGLFEQNLGGILFMLFIWSYGTIVAIFNIYTILDEKKERKRSK